MRWTFAVCFFLVTGFLLGESALVGTAVAQQQLSNEKGWQETPKPLAQRNRQGVTDEIRRARGELWCIPPNIVRSKPRVLKEGDTITGCFSDYISAPEPFSLCEAVSIYSITMTDFQPFLSNDENHIYTDLYFRVEEVLKSNKGKPLVGQEIATRTPGGTLQLPDGEIVRGSEQGKSPLQPGHKYVVFGDEYDYHRATDTYSWREIMEIQNGRMKPLRGDGQEMFKPRQPHWLAAMPSVLAVPPQSGRPPLPKVAGMPVEQFMDEVRRRLARCPD